MEPGQCVLLIHQNVGSFSRLTEAGGMLEIQNQHTCWSSFCRIIKELHTLKGPQKVVSSICSIHADQVKDTMFKQRKPKLTHIRPTMLVLFLWPAHFHKWVFTLCYDCQQRYEALKVILRWPLHVCHLFLVTKRKILNFHSSLSLITQLLNHSGDTVACQQDVIKCVLFWVCCDLIVDLVVVFFGALDQTLFPVWDYKVDPTLNQTMGVANMFSRPHLGR